MPIGSPVYRPCLWCGDYFWSLRRQQKCCSPDCQRMRGNELRKRRELRRKKAQA